MIAWCYSIALPALNIRFRRLRVHSTGTRRSTTRSFSFLSVGQRWRRGMWKAILAGLIALAPWGGHARAETFPSHPITIVVPFSAGGPSDAMSRILAERMKVKLGETILFVFVFCLFFSSDAADV